MLTHEAIQSLKEIMHHDYGVSISDDQAELLGEKVIRLALLARRSMLRRLGVAITEQSGNAGSSASPRDNKTGCKRGALLPPEKSGADETTPGLARA